MWGNFQGDMYGNLLLGYSAVIWFATVVGLVSLFVLAFERAVHFGLSPRDRELVSHD